MMPEASVLKLGASYPLPEARIREFCASVKRVIVVEVKPDHADALDEIGKTCASQLTRHIRTVTGVTVGVRVVAVGQVERSMGKAKRVIDLRGTGAD